MDQFILYGKQSVKELLFSNHPVDTIYIAKENPDKDYFIRLADQRSIKYAFIQKAHMQRVTGPVLHQGVAAEITEYKYINENELSHYIELEQLPLFVIADQIQDPHNLGAIIRTAEIAGATAVIIPAKSSAEINATVVKTSAGAVFHIPVFRSDNLSNTISFLQNKSITVAALMAYADKNIYNTNLNIPIALITGSEGKGVRKNLLRLCDCAVSIPQFGKVNSLNASVSAAIALYEIIRQRQLSQ